MCGRFDNSGGSFWAKNPSPYTKKISPHASGKRQDKHKERYRLLAVAQRVFKSKVL